MLCPTRGVNLPVTVGSEGQDSSRHEPWGAAAEVSVAAAAASTDMYALPWSPSVRAALGADFFRHSRSRLGFESQPSGAAAHPAAPSAPAGSQDVLCLCLEVEMTMAGPLRPPTIRTPAPTFLSRPTGSRRRKSIELLEEANDASSTLRMYQVRPSGGGSSLSTL